MASFGAVFRLALAKTAPSTDARPPEQWVDDPLLRRRVWSLGTVAERFRIRSGDDPHGAARLGDVSGNGDARVPLRGAERRPVASPRAERRSLEQPRRPLAASGGDVGDAREARRAVGKWSAPRRLRFRGGSHRGERDVAARGVGGLRRVVGGRLAACSRRHARERLALAARRNLGRGAARRPRAEPLRAARARWTPHAGRCSTPRAGSSDSS